MHLAFVLLAEPALPAPQSIADAYRSIAPSAPPFLGEASDKQDVVALSSKSGSFFVSLIPLPVPKGEAESAARFSLGYFGRGQTLGPHRAHLIVPFKAADGLTPFEQVQTFARILAAVIVASGAIAVYWGSASATHPADCFVDLARSMDVPMPLWNGVSMARTTQRVSLLSLGMNQLGLDDLLMTAPSNEANEVLAYFFDLLAYVGRRGKRIEEGETVGRTADEKAQVRYVPSPLDPSKRVFCVDL